MTRPGGDNSGDGMERDALLREAYARASQETPPPALDDAIRAAARRAVHATPEDDNRQRRRMGAAAWWPLAVAATLAAVTFGIAQLAPVDRSDADSRAAMRSESDAARDSKMAPTGAPPEARPSTNTPSPAAEVPPPEQSTAIERKARRGANDEAPRTAQPSLQRAPVAQAPAPANAVTPPENALAAPEAPVASPATDARVAPAPKAATASTAAGAATARAARESSAAAKTERNAADALGARIQPEEADASGTPAAAPRAPAAAAQLARPAPPYAQWLHDIETLLTRGDEAKARSELAKLLERYPEALPALPESLRPLVPSR